MAGVSKMTGLFPGFGEIVSTNTGLFSGFGKTVPPFKPRKVKIWGHQTKTIIFFLLALTSDNFFPNILTEVERL